MKYMPMHCNSVIMHETDNLVPERPLGKIYLTTQCTRKCLLAKEKAYIELQVNGVIASVYNSE